MDEIRKSVQKIGNPFYITKLNNSSSNHGTYSSGRQYKFIFGKYRNLYTYFSKNVQICATMQVILF